MAPSAFTLKGTKEKRLYTLRPLWKKVTVESCSDGTMRVTPEWRKGLGGMMSRIAGADRLQYLLNQYLKRRKLP